MLKCVMSRNCLVLQLEFVLTVKNTVWNHTIGLTPFSLLVIQVDFSAMYVGAAAFTSNEIMAAENLALFH